MKYLRIIFCLALCACQNDKAKQSLLAIDPEIDGQWVNMVVEIPAGTLEKWEVSKETGQIERDSVNGLPRTINYLGYPAHYGFVPQTLLTKSEGGDGDPLDILVLGESAKRGTILRCKVLGVLKLIDNDEQDDKLIAVTKDSPFANVDNVGQLDAQYPGTLEIIETWFINYKGTGKMQSAGFESDQAAKEVLKKFSK